MKILASITILAGLMVPAHSMSAIRPVADLVAMAAFVDGYCIDIRVNQPAARRAFQEAGGTPDWNEDPYNRTLVKLRVEVLKGNPPGNCAMFWDEYGPQGIRVPGLIESAQP